MGKIIELSPEIYNRIAAGEVIENPASAVKELVENSLDAESTDIKVIIKQSGKKEITVIDNGIGMDKDDLYLAVKKHTTSKINDINDLNKIKTMGFRGEALSSIISVSIAEISSKTEKMESGIKLTIEKSGKEIKESRAAVNRGTSVKVQNLFYNTPARFKFLKGDRKELLNIKEALTKLIIPNYRINFQLLYDDEKPAIYKSQTTAADRIKDVYGNDFFNELISFEKKTSNFSISGYIGKPSFNKPNRSYQYLFLNKRPIVTHYFNYWISKGYENLLVNKRYPVAFIFIDAPPDFYDVNVHPAKREVRFVNEYLISQTLINTVKNILNTGLLIPNVQKDHVLQKEGVSPEEEQMFIKKIDHSIDKFLSVHKTGNIYKQHPVMDKKGKVYTSSTASLEKESGTAADYWTLFNTYILYEDKGTDSIYIIDQHAAHERILYERLKRAVEKNEDISQNLLIPINLQLSALEYQVVMDNQKIFNETGYNIEDFGNNSIIINSIPSYVVHRDDKQLFSDILSELIENKKIEKTRLKDDILKTMACKSAIKAGEKLQPQEIETLIKALLETEVRYTCPHGRPAVIQLKKIEIEKWFKRK